ncbi:MAG: hypothetical protein JW967_09425 [Dehalococcoidales bacterium]|nr:hypothetical protein [Dehalococcoidales bacterium]
MKRTITALLLLCLCILLPTGCKETTPGETVNLGQEYQLYIGQTVTFSDTDLKVKFGEVIEDSRCPGDVVCIWAGRVSCLVEVTIDNESSNTVLTELGLSEGYTTTQYEHYILQFRVEPYPQSGTEISDRDYRLLLTVTEAP